MTDAELENRDLKDQFHKLSDEEKRKGYRAAFATLPRLTQKVFWAHRIDDLSYIEIAKRYGITIREVEREMARAIYGIDRALAARESEPRRRCWLLRWFTELVRF